MHFETRRIGELTCRIIRPEHDGPSAGVVVLCHGFGAPGDDLVGLTEAYVHFKPALAESVWFVYPEAPLTIPEVPGGRAWWPIDIMEMQLAIMQGRFREMRQSVPEQMPAAREKLSGVIDALRAETSLPLSRFILGGFSQGSMVTTDVTLRLPESPGALIVHSGTLLAEPEWRELAPRRAGLLVLQTHGTIDPILPFEAAEWLRDLLTDAGMEVSFLSFPGVHTIPPQGVQKGAALMEQVFLDAP